MLDTNLISTKENQIQEEFEIDFFEWMIALGKEKATILLTFMTITISSFIYSLIIDPTFIAKGTLFVSSPQTNTVASSTLAMLGAGFPGVLGGVKSQEETFIAYFYSDRFLDKVIFKLNLQERHKTQKIVDIRDQLRSTVRISIDKKSNFLIIEAENSNPNFAALLVNTFIDELTFLIEELSLESTQQRFLYFEKAINKTKSELLEAKSAFRDTKEQSPVISTSSLAENTFIQIQNKELQINAMSYYTTKENPDIQRLEAELVALRKQLYKSDINSSSSKKADIKETIAIDKYREIKSLESILSTLSAQYKVAITEAYSTNPSHIQILDKAFPPERRAKPQRNKIVIISAIAGLLLGILIGVLRIKLRKLFNNTEFSSNINELRNSWLKIN
jgi:uncharacterized protein involved in exopolysaccharide biosynthesis